MTYTPSEYPLVEYLACLSMCATLGVYLLAILALVTFFSRVLRTFARGDSFELALSGDPLYWPAMERAYASRDQAVIKSYHRYERKCQRRAGCYAA